MIRRVVVTKRAISDLQRLPQNIQNKLLFLVGLVEQEGLERVRMIKSFHDEPLKGRRSGQRSIRLNRSYRAIYVILSDDSVRFISVEEVNKHEY